MLRSSIRGVKLVKMYVARLKKILLCQQDDDFFNGFEAIEISIGKRVQLLKVFLWLLS